MSTAPSRLRSGERPSLLGCAAGLERGVCAESGDLRVDHPRGVGVLKPRAPFRGTTAGDTVSAVRANEPRATCPSTVATLTLISAYDDCRVRAVRLEVLSSPVSTLGLHAIVARLSRRGRAIWAPAGQAFPGLDMPFLSPVPPVTQPSPFYPPARLEYSGPRWSCSGQK